MLRHDKPSKVTTLLAAVLWKYMYTILGNQFFFLHVLLIFGTVYLTMLSMLILSTYLKHALTGSGWTKMQNMISLPTWLELLRSVNVIWNVVS